MPTNNHGLSDIATHYTNIWNKKYSTAANRLFSTSRYFKSPHLPEVTSLALSNIPCAKYPANSKISFQHCVVWCLFKRTKVMAQFDDLGTTQNLFTSNFIDICFFCLSPNFQVSFPTVIFNPAISGPLLCFVSHSFHLPSPPHSSACSPLYFYLLPFVHFI